MFAGFYAIAFRIDDKLRAEQYVPGDNPVVDLSKYVKMLGIKVTRLAYGIPVGASLEFADDITLGRALDGRNEM